MDIKTKIALIGIAISALFAAGGLILNFYAVRKNNRITVSTKLAEASKLLSDELVAKCRSWQLYRKELSEAEAHPESEERTNKIASLKKLIDDNLARQKEIDKETDELDGLFGELDRVDPGAVDKAICQSYRRQSHAKSSLDLAQRLKDQDV